MIGRVAGRPRAGQLLLLVALGSVVARPPIHARPLAGSPGFQGRDELVDLQVQAAADQLLALVARSNGENTYYPTFAKEKIDWIGQQAKAAKLSILLLKDVSAAKMDNGTLMASAVVNGKGVIFIVQPRLMRLLREEGAVRAPFTQRQKNNFMLGLVHEAVHLTRQKTVDLSKPADRLREELRAWWEVSLKVVRPLRDLNQPMHSQFVQVDRAFRACGDRQECPFVGSIISGDPITR
jgi:hypothetical protein